MLGYLKHRLREKPCLRYRRMRPEHDPLVIPLCGLCDASFNNTSDCRSMTGWLLFAAGGLIHWHTGLTRIICLSTTESEAYALSDLVKEVLHVVQLTAELGLAVTPVQLGTDNRGSLRNAQGGTCARTRHFDYRILHARAAVKSGIIELQHVPTQWNLSDLMSKPMRGQSLQFAWLRDRILSQCCDGCTHAHCQ